MCSFITMDDASLVRVFQPVGDLLGDGQDFVQGNRPLCDPAGKGSSDLPSQCARITVDGGRPMRRIKSSKRGRSASCPDVARIETKPGTWSILQTLLLATSPPVRLPKASVSFGKEIGGKHSDALTAAHS